MYSHWKSPRRVLLMLSVGAFRWYVSVGGMAGVKSDLQSIYTNAVVGSITSRRVVVSS